MWLPYEGTIDFFYLSLLLPICPFDLVLSSLNLQCKDRMYLIYILRLKITKFVANKISESITIRHPSVWIRIGLAWVPVSCRTATLDFFFDLAESKGYMIT